MPHIESTIGLLRQGGSMNQFVYLVHLEYRDHGPLPANVSRLRPQTPSERAARLPAQLQRYLPDPQVRISGERIRHDPEVVRVTVATNLDEAVADAAFVRFITDCNRLFFLERSGASWTSPAIAIQSSAF